MSHPRLLMLNKSSPYSKSLKLHSQQTSIDYFPFKHCKFILPEVLGKDFSIRILLFVFQRILTTTTSQVYFCTSLIAAKLQIAADEMNVEGDYAGQQRQLTGQQDLWGMGTKERGRECVWFSFPSHSLLI